VDPTGHNRTHNTMESDSGGGHGDGYTDYDPAYISSLLKQSYQEQYEEFEENASPLVQDILNFNKLNNDEDVVLESNYFSVYKGSFVIRISSKNPNVTSCAILGTIFLNTKKVAGDKNSQVTVEYEWGHLVQEKILGLPYYIAKIAIPSLAHRNPTDYYSQPWERGTDFLGGVTDREYSNGKNYVYSTTGWESIGYMFDPDIFSAWFN